MIMDAESSIQVINVPDFWSRVYSATVRLLVLDYDGTLAPFHSQRFKAQPLPGIPDTLRKIKEDPSTRLAVISGRPVCEVLTFLGDLGITLVGSHGFEMVLPGGELWVKSSNLQQLKGLEEAERLISIQNLDAQLEVKVASIAFHTRGMTYRDAVDLEERIYRQWSLLAPAYELECRRFNGGVEIRTADRNKGVALTEIIAAQPGESFSVYIGDDESDEDAFRVLQGRGVGIKVGDPAMPTAAAGFLPDCVAVRNFLETWVEIAASTCRRST